MISIVLSRRDFRETDQIITLYTAEKGKISALARGVKKITSKNSAFLEPFFLVEAEVVPGKELTRLTRVQPIDAFKNIRLDFDKIRLAGHAVGLMDRLIQSEESDRAIFYLILDYLKYLDSAIVLPAMLSSAFFARLLKVLGFDISEVPEMARDLRLHMSNLTCSGWQDVDKRMDRKCESVVHSELHSFARFHCERELANFSGIW
ncbi:DNA repair protein RecO [Patescibacteria group bacterium]|nr:DNA repair protein RecO [Patescibacteria group bacterium]